MAVFIAFAHHPGPFGFFVRKKITWLKSSILIKDSGGFVVP